jgi:tetratricopeptide (TPR) repeat protein
MSARHRWAAWWLHGLARLVPERRREWAEAMAAELEEIESGWEARRWSVSGSLSLLGSILVTWTKGEDARGAAMARGFVVLSLVAVCLLLVVTPVVRHGIRTIWDVWSYYTQSLKQEDWRKIEGNQEAKSDPDAIAWMALSAHDASKADALAREAVQRDSSLPWLYTELVEQYGTSAMVSEWTEKLRAWDPENAMPYLVSARAISARERSDNRFVRDEAWLTQMQLAFDAKRFDSYLLRRMDLERRISKRYGEGSPLHAFGVLIRFPTIPLYDVRLYNDKLVASGDESGYRKALKFAQTIYLGANTDLEQYFARGMIQGVSEGLAPKLEQQGRTEEAGLLRFQAEEMRKAIQDFRKSNEQNSESWSVQLICNAGVIHLAALLAMVGGIGLVVTLFSAGAHRLLGKSLPYSRTAAATFAGIMVSSMAMLYFAYRPYQESYERFLNAQQIEPRQLAEFGSMLRVPFVVFRNNTTLTLWGWQLVICTLIGMLLFIA